MANISGRKDTVPSKIADDIIGEIKRSIYKADDKLPSRKDLAFEYGVHENTIKKVFGILRKRKLVKYKPHSGIFVSPLPKGFIKIALVMPEEYFDFDNLLKGAKEVCERQRASLEIFRYKDSAEQLAILADLESHSCDGVIIHSKFSDAAALMIDKLHSCNIPVVLIGTPVQEGFLCSKVQENYSHAAYAATLHLIETKHKSIAIIIPKNDRGLEFTDGYSRAMAEFDKRVYASFLQYADDDKTPGESTARFLSDKRFFSGRAVIYFSPEFAVPGIETIKKHGLKIGRDISVICCGDFSGSENYNPPLSVIRFDNWEIGYKACDLLFQHLKNPDKHFDSSRASMELVVRESAVQAPRGQICLSEIQRQRWAENPERRFNAWDIPYYDY